MVDDLASDTPPSSRPTGKRRRIPASIASSNAHLQFLNPRQNRWLHGWTNTATSPATTTNASLRSSDASPSSAVSPPREIPESATVDPRAQNNLTAKTVLQTLPNATSALSTAPERLERTPQEQELSIAKGGAGAEGAMHASSALQHEAGGSSMPAPTTNLRKSMDAAATARSLPSPAPSDENTNSPTFGQGRFPSRRGRPSSSRTPTQASTMTNTIQVSTVRPSGQTVPEQVMYTGYTQQNQVPQNVPGARPQQWSMPELRRPSNHSRPSSMNTVPSNGFGSPSIQTQPSPHLNSPGGVSRPPAPIVHTASRLPVPQLLAQLDAQRERLSRINMLQSTDSGRLALLRDAVVKHDWFYQMLSQIFCLYSISPTMLPRVLRPVTSQSFNIIGALLCTNDNVNPTLLRFFADFPEPVMTIYSDNTNAREVYEYRLQSISIFLQRLPVHWDGLVEKCKVTLAPPLVQDMVDILNMQSEVLQTTVFRAIARMFWGLEESAGMKVIEEVNFIDQQNYYRYGFRRNQQEKHWAYRMMAFVYEQWQSYRQACGPHDNLNNFSMPYQVRECFSKRSRLSAPAQEQTLAQSQLQAQAQAQPPQQQPPRPQIELITAQHIGAVHQALLRNERYRSLQPEAQQAYLQQVLQAQLYHNHQLGHPHQDARTPQGPADMARAAQLHHQVRNGLDFSIGLPLASPGIVASQRGSLTPGGSVSKRLYPGEKSTQRPQPTHPNPDVSALHQAHLRSPKLLPQVVNGQKTDVLCRHVIGYALTPAKLQVSSPVQTLEFTISSSTMARVARSQKSPMPGEPPTRKLSDSSITYRLRCCIVPPTGYTDESSWITSDNFWPEGMSLSLNEVQLETRRKLHHGRYLPIDVTDVVRRDTNKLRITFNRKDGAAIRARYAVAIEAIGVTTPAAIKSKLNRITAEESLTAIKKSLADGNNSDDDIAVTSSSTTISLIDPYFLANLVETPVRGLTCLHRDCFDLDTFLSLCTRTDPNDLTSPTVADCWKCPLCRGDVRPQMLVVDEFLISVKEELVRRGQTDTRAIQVQADGTWKPKEEDATGVRSASLEREEQRARKKSGPVEIIELD